MVAILFLSLLPLVEPFLTAPSQKISSVHHSLTSTSPSSSSSAVLSYSSTSYSYRNIQRLHINENSRRRRHCNTFLLASKSGHDDNDNKDVDSNSQMPSDDALFRDTIGGGDGIEDEDDEPTLSVSDIIYGDDNYDDEDEYEYDYEDITEDEPYAQTAPSEFAEVNENATVSGTSLASALARGSRELNTSPHDWGGALSTLRSRVSDIESGKSTNPSTALFRTISRERPNEAIGRFVREANPEVVASMTGAVSSLLGSLSNPAMGMETIVQASSEKLGNLCFQLMMTGYMFRNAEYVLALKSLMNIRGEGATLEEYRAAFNRIDRDGSGYLERDEIEALLADVYEGEPPSFEIQTFLEFFDSNNDGRVSWEEFEKGFGVVTSMGGKDESNNNAGQKMNGFSLPGGGSIIDEDDDDEMDSFFGEPAISGTIQVELEDGKVIEVDAQEYVNDLKQQALELKRELAQEKGLDPKEMGIPDDKNAAGGGNPLIPNSGSGGIASYISSLQGDVKSLTQGISPEVVESMKMLIDFVLEGGPEGGGNKKAMDKKKEMELPGSALQQLALWQLVIGYRLRETEATGEWRKMLE